MENVKLCRESLGREKPGWTQLLKQVTFTKPTLLIDTLIEIQLSMWNSLVKEVLKILFIS